MKITIDTKQDHPIEIEHAMRLLSAILNKKYKSNHLFNKQTAYGIEHENHKYNERDYNSERYNERYNDEYGEGYKKPNPINRDAFSSDTPTIGGGFASMFGDDANQNNKIEEYGAYDNAFSKEEENKNFTIKPY